MFILCEPLKLLNITLEMLYTYRNMYLSSKIVNFKYGGKTKKKSLVCCFLNVVICVFVNMKHFLTLVTQLKKLTSTSLLICSFMRLKTSG